MPKIVVFLQFKLKKTEKSLQKYNRLEAELKMQLKEQPFSGEVALVHVWVEQDLWKGM